MFVVVVVVLVLVLVIVVAFVLVLVFVLGFGSHFGHILITGQIWAKIGSHLGHSSHVCYM